MECWEYKTLNVAAGPTENNKTLKEDKEKKNEEQ